MLQEIKRRIGLIRYTLAHRKALQALAKAQGYSFPWHDLDKVFMYLFLGKKLASKLHRRFARHHYRQGDIINKVEAAFDWESARYTKPDKPLDAYDTWRKYYPDVDMAGVLNSLGMLKGRPAK